MAESLNIDITKFVEDSAKKDIEKKYSFNVLMRMLTENLHADITLQVQGSCVKAHRCVLAGASSVFQAMFKHEMKEQVTSTVEISDMSMEGLQLFLILIYTSTNEKNDNVPVFEAAVKKHWVELFEASQKYEVADRLKCILSSALPKVLTSDNCWDYGRITTLDYGWIATHNYELLVRFVRYLCRFDPPPENLDLGRPDYVCFKYILDNFDKVVVSNGTLLEMKRNPELVWRVIKLTISSGQLFKRARRIVDANDMPVARKAST